MAKFSVTVRVGKDVLRVSEDLARGETILTVTEAVSKGLHEMGLNGVEWEEPKKRG